MDIFMRYRKKPIVVEAFQMTKERRQDNAVWSEDYPNSNGKDKLCIGTKEGVYIVTWNDWIIQDIQGELYPCKPDIFEATYEKVEGE